MKLLNKFLVGCDPEFVVLDKAGNHVNVARLIAKEGSFGYDHNGDVLEVRPEPNVGIFVLIRRIAKILKEEKLKATGTSFRAGALFQTGRRKVGLGGHVHFGFPVNDPSSKIKVKALDELTKVLESLDILPKGESAARRAQFKDNDLQFRYGRFGDVRAAGPENRMEYRTMASWLFSPITSFVCLTAAKLAAVAPERAIELLKDEDLTKFFEAFQEDANAKRVLERLIERKVKLQRAPDKNLLTTWEEELHQLK